MVWILRAIPRMWVVRAPTSSVVQLLVGIQVVELVPTLVPLRTRTPARVALAASPPLVLTLVATILYAGVHLLMGVLLP